MGTPCTRPTSSRVRARRASTTAWRSPEKIGDEVLSARADASVADLPDGLVYAGFSFGVGEAQRLAQTRPGARGALLYEGCMPITGEWAFGPWPDGVPVQIHGMEEDPVFG